jgi:hypothetical protein
MLVGEFTLLAQRISTKVWGGGGAPSEQETVESSQIAQGRVRLGRGWPLLYASSGCDDADPRGGGT